MRASRPFLLLFLLAQTVFAQVRLAPLTPRLSPAPAVSASPALSAALAPMPSMPALSAVLAPAAPSPAILAAPAPQLSAASDLAAPAQTQSAPSAAPAATAALPSWLKLTDRKHAAALATAVALALNTDAGRQAFDAAGRALSSDKPLPVDVRGLGRNNGEYDYLDHRLRLDRKLFQPGREADLAGTLAHELTHVAQHAAGLPSNALELEIQAHLRDLALADELGVQPGPHTFARQAREALAEGAAKFIALLQAAVPGSPFLGESSVQDIVEQMEDDLAEQMSRASLRASKLAGAISADIELLRSKKGRAAYRAFSRRVLAELERRSAAARNK